MGGPLQRGNGAPVVGPTGQPAFADAQTVEAVVGDVLRAWAARYGSAIADLHVSGTTSMPADVGQARGARVVVRGAVLVPSQKTALARALETAFGTDPPVDIEVVARTEGNVAAAWLRAGRTGVDIVAAPRSGAALTTQWDADEPPLRLLVGDGDWLAVELADRTVGWAASDAVGPVVGAEPRDVASWRADWSGRASATSGSAWHRAAEAWLGAPYRLGGRHPDGVDCSGLTQRIFKDVIGIGLPRHSKDQARFGLRTGQHELGSGDLLYLTHVESGRSHVAVVLLAGSGGTARAAIHACLDHGVVTQESLSALLMRYDFRAGRHFPPGYCPA